MFETDVHRELTQVLYGLKEEAANAWKQSMEGRMPDPYALGRAWSNVETIIKQLDALARFQQRKS